MNRGSFDAILRTHIQRHAEMEPQDVVKLCYQAALGAEHMLTHRDKALGYFQEEYDRTIAVDTPLFEPVSQAYSRAHLAAWKHLGLPPVWLFNMFYHTATEPSRGSSEQLHCYLDTVEQYAKAGAFTFSAHAWQSYRNHYEASGGGPVHHSETYRQMELPAYRVVKVEYERLMPVLLELSGLIPKHGPKVVAIDGRAAAGKTTTAALIAELIDAIVIHMDDFFLPPELRTGVRLAEPGGNIHYERFKDEVLPYLRKPTGFTYRCFDCEQMAYDQMREITPGSWRIVEGVYSCHPSFGEYMDLRIFCDVASDEQLQRIIARNGKQMAAVFSSKWIPMEEKYFTTERIRDKAAVIL